MLAFHLPTTVDKEPDFYDKAKTTLLDKHGVTKTKEAVVCINGVLVSF